MRDNATRLPTLCLAILVASLATGCASFRVEAGTNDDAGLLYYPPKPYLLVTKNVNVTQKPAAEPPKNKDPEQKPKQELLLTEDGKSIFENVNLGGLLRTPQYGVQVIFLPDLANPQRVHLNAGIGKVDATYGFVDGWQLAALNVKLNSQVPETIGAVGSLVGAVAGAIPAPTAAADSGMSRLDAAVQILGMLTGGGTSTTGTTDPSESNLIEREEIGQRFAAETRRVDAETRVKNAIAALLESLRDDLEPRAWLFEVKVVGKGEEKTIEFDLKEGLNPFTFR